MYICESLIQVSSGTLEGRQFTTGRPAIISVFYERVTIFQQNKMQFSDETLNWYI